MYMSNTTESNKRLYDIGKQLGDSGIRLWKDGLIPG